VLVAFGAGGIGDRWESLPRKRRTPKTRVEVGELRDELARVRTQGHAVDDEEYHEGVRCVAAPVRDAHGDVVAALGITATTGRFPARQIPLYAGVVAEHAATLSSALGAKRPA